MNSRAFPTELYQLERRTLATELLSFEPTTALSTELDRLEVSALEKAASSLELRTEHSSFQRERRLASLCGPRFLTSGAQGGVLSSKRLHSSLTLGQLELVVATPWLKPSFA